MKKYPLPITHYPSPNLYHIDLYRVAILKDVYSFGFDEVLKDERGIIVIEWAEKVMKILPKERLIIEFDFLSENERKIVFKPKGERYKELVSKVIGDKFLNQKIL
jgi:tRNA threonylcarbamoyladenosine biosynthesis protein TsaE